MPQIGAFVLGGVAIVVLQPSSKLPVFRWSDVAARGPNLPVILNP